MSKCKCKYLSMLDYIDARDHMLTDWQQGLVDQIRQTVDNGVDLGDQLEQKLRQIFEHVKKGDGQ